ncbi:hypothetical protein GCM10010121_006470 [Streptomyces brasiliensis]|uniref:Uncharacterized protein n=1 Tax=Streptomyces brasiliensis TaxID=1954 RepID=A0A917K5K5_9ACTN|nr:hypothetical protein GCM10010121_006470 [Streptomyces brasiliensis]
MSGAVPVPGSGPAPGPEESETGRAPGADPDVGPGPGAESGQEPAAVPEAGPGSDTAQGAVGPDRASVRAVRGPGAGHSWCPPASRETSPQDYYYSITYPTRAHSKGPRDGEDMRRGRRHEGARGTARPATTHPHPLRDTDHPSHRAPLDAPGTQDPAGAPEAYAVTSDRSPPHSVWNDPSRSARR